MAASVNREPRSQELADCHGLPLTTGRFAVAQLQQTIQTAGLAAQHLHSWLRDLPGRLLGREAAALAIDSAVFVTVELPPVFFWRAVDLSRALASADKRAALKNPKAAAVRAAHSTLDVLGGGFVKIAQVVAHSPAFFPPALVRACHSSLAQASTPSAAFPEVERAIAVELGVPLCDVFANFEQKPMACASIAQVHAATLVSGERCVVKVVRPRVYERLAVDFQALSLFARLSDLILGNQVVLQFVSSPLEACIDELRGTVMDECNLDIERKNIDTFREWLFRSTSLRRAQLQDSVRVPRTHPHASGRRVLTMERMEGMPLSEVCEAGELDLGTWQGPLVKALAVAALSVIDDPGVFHADLHSGNMIIGKDVSTGSRHVAFIDFGCCGRLPRPLRATLLLQASAFAGETPDVRQFSVGFAHALERLPGLGTNQLDIDALAQGLSPLFDDFESLDMFGKGIDPLNPGLHCLLFRLQTLLFQHGVQLPREFTLLMKTGCFGSLYLSKLDDLHRSKLNSHLMSVGAAYTSCNLKECSKLLSPATLAALLKVLAKSDRTLIVQSISGACVPSSCFSCWAKHQKIEGQ